MSRTDPINFRRQQPTVLRPPRFSVGFADDLGRIKGKLPWRAGEIEIPSGNQWLAREIIEFAQGLVSALLAKGKLADLGFWRDDLFLGLKEALNNSFAHAVRQTGRVWVRWKTDRTAFVLEVVDEGNRHFNLDAKSAGEIICDAVGDPLCGKGIGMGYIRRSADQVEVVPVQPVGNKVVFTKYL